MNVKERDYSISDEAYEAKQLRRGLNVDGSEALDPKPMQPPIGFVRQPSMVDHIRQMVQSELLRHHARREERETFEEADDFDVSDDEEPRSAYEMEEVFEPQTGGQGPAQPARETLDGPAAPTASPAAPAAPAAGPAPAASVPSSSGS